MSDLKYEPVLHDHEAFLKKAMKRKGFKEAYDALEAEYSLMEEKLSAGKQTEHKPDSPFDGPGIKTQASMQGVLEAIRESRT
jgi:hypothetical protein